MSVRPGARTAWGVVVLLLAACGPRAGGVREPSPTAGPDAGPGARDAAPLADAAPPDAPPEYGADDGLDPPPLAGYLKGQLHLHSNQSGDSDVPGETIVEFYQRHGYDFIVVTDHNEVTRLADSGEMLVLAGVELTYNTTTCTPPPEKKKCLVHVNSLFVAARVPPDLGVVEVTSEARIDLYQRFLDASDAMGGLTMLNHPNFQWTLDANLAIELVHRGARLFEFANQGMPLSNPGDATHPSTELMWDIVLSSGVDVWGVASDDAHDYEDAKSLQETGARNFVYPGNLGWVMVHAERDPTSIRAAVERGDFYASNGVVLGRLEVTGDQLVVEAAGPGRFRVEFVGVGGQVLTSIKGRLGSFPLDGARGGYVRARVLRDDGKTAWTQPVRAR